jgi:hypothetical protein
LSAADGSGEMLRHDSRSGTPAWECLYPAGYLGHCRGEPLCSPLMVGQASLSSSAGNRLAKTQERKLSICLPGMIALSCFLQTSGLDRPVCGIEDLK